MKFISENKIWTYSSCVLDTEKQYINEIELKNKIIASFMNHIMDLNLKIELLTKENHFFKGKFGNNESCLRGLDPVQYRS